MLIVLLAGCSSSNAVSGDTFVPTIASITANEPAAGVTAAQFEVSGHAMDSTATDGDTLLVDETAYASAAPERGQVIVFSTKEAAGSRTLVKRVVAVPGDTVEYRACVLTIDGAVVPEPYLDPTIVEPDLCGSDQPALTLAAGQYFTMGDNRGGSKDSRDLGPIALADIVGRATAVIAADGSRRPL